MSDWKDDKDLGPWAFTPQPNKWGYLNNPRWQDQPVAPINYDGLNEPQIWQSEQSGYSSDDSKQHIPCGHWHKLRGGGGGGGGGTSTLVGFIYNADVLSGRVLLLTVSPLARGDYWDANPNMEVGDYISYGCTVDSNNHKAYVSYRLATDNYYNFIYEVSLPTMTPTGRSLQVEATNSNNVIRGMSNDCPNGKLYLFMNPGYKLYEVDIASLTITRTLTFTAHSYTWPLYSDSQPLYIDTERGYIYYVSATGGHQTGGLWYPTLPYVVRRVKLSDFTLDDWMSDGLQGSWADGQGPTTNLGAAYDSETGDMYVITLEKKINNKYRAYIQKVDVDSGSVSEAVDTGVGDLLNPILHMTIGIASDYVYVLSPVDNNGTPAFISKYDRNLGLINTTELTVPLGIENRATFNISPDGAVGIGAFWGDTNHEVYIQVDLTGTQPVQVGTVDYVDSDDKERSVNSRLIPYAYTQ